MRLYISSRTPNRRRVLMFMREKNLAGIETVEVDLLAGDHRAAAFTAKNPMAQVPVLDPGDGRMLAETRAICTYLEGLQPEPNLMGDGFEECAFIEMADRRTELQLFLQAAHWIRHVHPALAPLEQPQFPDYGATQAAPGRSLPPASGRPSSL